MGREAKLHDIASEHLGRVSKERAFYQDVCNKAKETKDIGRHDPCSYDGDVQHYSIDFAQQVHYPSNTLQPGPVRRPRNVQFVRQLNVRQLCQTEQELLRHVVLALACPHWPTCFDHDELFTDWAHQVFM